MAHQRNGVIDWVYSMAGVMVRSDETVLTDSMSSVLFAAWSISWCDHCWKHTRPASLCYLEAERWRRVAFTYFWARGLRMRDFIDVS